MHLSNWDVYWFTRLEEVKSLLTFRIDRVFTLGIILGIIYFAGCMLFSMNEDDVTIKTRTLNQMKKSIKPIALYFGVPAILTFVAAFIPTQKEAAAIIMLPAIINNEELQRVPDNVLKLLNVKLEEWLSDSTESGSSVVPVKK